MMSWTKAVWLEDNEEVEGVVPTVWVDEKKNILWWPKKMLHVIKSYKKQEVPKSDWKVFTLIKVKLSDDDEELCQAYAYTDTETSATELIVDKLTPVSKSKPAALPFMPKKLFGFEKKEQHSQTFSSSTLKRKAEHNDFDSRSEMSQKNKYDCLSQETALPFMPKKSFGFEKKEQHSQSFLFSTLKKKVEHNGFDSTGEMSQTNKYDGLSQKSQTVNEDDSDCNDQDIHFTTQQSLSPLLNKTNKYNAFSLSQANFQYRVLHLLTDIKTNGCGKCFVNEGEIEITTEMDNLTEFDKFDSTLDNVSAFNSAKRRLQNIGGKSCQKLVIAMMKSYMTNSLMSKFNMAGGKGKRSFRQTKLYKLIKVCASMAHESYTESGVDAIVAGALKRAPFTHAKMP
ncbi:uncharacterized protein LOC136082361 isoform X1 [Hydra vulgaris]|uniref:Uncharacterized protein LOC136082361 isoform X1 n=1 Tax=Hydra vulgaris TaxID=6087 RepID=A0ABM4C7C5_HYDVU